MKESIFVVALPISTTNDELRIIMGKLKELREGGHYSNIILTVSGFGADRRELSEIVEVRAFCQRLIDQGFVSYLDYTTTIPGPKVPVMARRGYGAFEVWLCANGWRTVEVTRLLLKQFDAVLDESNATADRTVGKPEV